MGPLGLVLAAIGIAGMFVAQGRIELACAGLGERADRSLGRLRYAVIVIAVAVGLYFAARRFGQGRAGLYVGVAILSANAAVVAALRVRWTRALGASGEVVALVARASCARMVASWVAFVGCAIYLLRP